MTFVKVKVSDGYQFRESLFLSACLFSTVELLFGYGVNQTVQMGRPRASNLTESGSYSLFDPQRLMLLLRERKIVCADLSLTTFVKEINCTFHWS